MSRLEKTTEWVYRGIWGVLTNWFRVPAEPPALPVAPGEHLHPSALQKAFCVI